MLFNSLHFMIFLPLVVAAYFMMPHRHRWKFMLVASYYFYMCWKVEYILLIIVSTLIDYWAGVKMGSLETKAQKKPWLMLSVCMNLGILFAFKYFNFVNESLRSVFDYFNIFYNVPFFKVLLPVGISFYTFQTMSYSISVYKGLQKPERHLGIFALYVAYFPQLVAGPIERSTNLLPQFYTEQRFSYENTVSGLRLIMWGMFKKVVIADRLGVLVAYVFGNPKQFDGVAYIIATLFFAYQVFCDFSGYSDIAIGTARIFGVRLMVNFNRPFFAKTLADLWNRWHISLSTWFRDYLYISLGGNRCGSFRRHFNVFFTFLISGLWHGADWNYVIWGATHGVFLVIEMLTTGIKLRFLALLHIRPGNLLYKIQGIVITFSIFCFALLIFRNNDLGNAWHMITHLFDGVGGFLGSLLHGDLNEVRAGLRGLGMTQKEMAIGLIGIGLLETVHFIQRGSSISEKVSAMPTAIRWALYYGLVASVLFFGAYNQSAQFIYFQF